MTSIQQSLKSFESIAQPLQDDLGKPTHGARLDAKPFALGQFAFGQLLHLNHPLAGTINPALAVAVPAPEGQGVVIGPVTAAAVFWFLALVDTIERRC